MSDIRQARKTLARRILEGAGKASPSERGPRSTTAASPNHTDEDFAAVKVSGLSEDQVFEIVVCAAIGQATRQYDTALAALEAATGKE